MSKQLSSKSGKTDSDLNMQPGFVNQTSGSFRLKSMKVNPLQAIPENLEKGDGDKDDSDSFKETASLRSS